MGGAKGQVGGVKEEIPLGVGLAPAGSRVGWFNSLKVLDSGAKSKGRKGGKRVRL